MLIRKAYKFKLKTNTRIEQKMSQMAGCCRLLWNKALALNLSRLEGKSPLLWYNELAFWLTFWKKTDELNFLNDCHSQALQQTLKHLDRAFRDGFDKKQPNKRIPKFKKRFANDSFCYPQGFKFDNRRIFLPKIGWVRFYKSRGIHGTPKNVTVKREADGWYVSIQVELESTQSFHPSSSIVGVDVGVCRFATLSTGKFFEPLNSLRNTEFQLIKAQRKLARMQTRSKNWGKQKRKIAKIHLRIRNRRLDYIHWVSSRISKNHAIVVLEDLNVQEMSKSAKGSLENPGENVRIKSGLNKSILDQGFGLFRDFLTYKLRWLGGDVICVNPQYTSQMCPKCRNIDLRNRPTQSHFKCIHCDYSENADVVGATNILAAGLAVLACEANSIRSRQQELVGNRKEVLSLI